MAGKPTSQPISTYSHSAASGNDPAQSGRSVLEVLLIFLRLGLTSFGGPIAHLGYFREEFVVKRRWLDGDSFADLLALCQFLPGPASSQVGFALGLARKGILGGLAAWVGFTLPSALVLFVFAQSAAALTGKFADAALHGLKLVAVAVVAQAVWGMARTLVPDSKRASITLAAMLIVIFVAGSFGQLGAILLGALLGVALCRQASPLLKGRLSFSISRRVGVYSLIAFVTILIAGPLLASGVDSHALAVFDAFYRSGALVFGGGHVVLPLLKATVVDPGWVTTSSFLSGYGAAQAIPGPLFTLSAYLGAVLSTPPNGLEGAVIALVGIFLPGMLILLGTLPFWDEFRKRQGAQAIMRGVNAAVVGILAAALYDPVWTSAVYGSWDFALVLAGFLLLTVWKCPPCAIVAGMTLSAIGLAMLA